MKKRLGVITLLTCVLVMMAPALALADDSAQYTEAESMQTIVTDASVHVYATTGAGSVELTDANLVSSTFSQGIGYREYTATPNEGWVWKNWTYNQMFRGADLGNRTDYVFGYRYSFSNNGDSWREPYNGTGNTISVNRLTTAGEIAGVPITYNLYANFNPTIKASAGDGGSISDAGVNEVEYGTDMSFTITPDEGYAVSAVIVDGQAVEPVPTGEYTFSNVTAPHTIAVEFSKVFSVTYTDGVDDEEVFADQVVTGLFKGDATPQFDGKTVREGYIFGGWDPEVAETVTENATYAATWKVDSNNNGIADEDENHYTVTYTDGVDGEEIFADQVTTDILDGSATPEFDGTPTRDGYTFAGWAPEVAETVTDNVTYVAVWEAIPAKDDTDKEDPNKDDSEIVNPGDNNSADSDSAADNNSAMNGSDKNDSGKDNNVQKADTNKTQTKLPQTNDPMSPLALTLVALTALSGAFVAFRKSFN